MQASERDESRIKQILLAVNTALTPLITQNLMLIIQQRENMDKLTIVAMHCLILAHTYFIHSSMVSQLQIVKLLIFLFLYI